MISDMVMSIKRILVALCVTFQEQAVTLVRNMYVVSDIV